MKKVNPRFLLILGLLAVLVSGLCILFVDQALALWLKEIQVSQFYRIYRTVTDIGEAVFYFGFAGFVLVSSWLALKFHPKLSESWRLRALRTKEQSLFFLASLIGSGIVLHLFKMLFGRQRPHMTPDFQAHIFHPFNLHWHSHSMPSGHSQTLFTVATVCWLLYPKSGWIVFPAAAVVACTRLPMQAHFLSDVLIGSYIGFLVTVLVARWFARRYKLPEL
jgi:membrane-associated phospholipid phosphatase